MESAVQARIAEYIATQVGASTKLEVVNTAILRGGESKHTWLFELDLSGGPQTGRQQFVVRIQSAELMPFSHNISQEYHLSKFLFSQEFRVPEPLFLCEDTDVSGNPFYVMPRIPGRSNAARLVSDLSETQEGNDLIGDIAECLAGIHAIRPPQEELIFLESPPESPAQKAVDSCHAYIDKIVTNSSALAYPVLEWGLRWLRNNLPRRESLVLSHGDFRLGNMLVSEKKLTGIMDFEYMYWSDPHEDLAAFCAKNARYGAPEMVAGGLTNREVFFEAYSKCSKREVDSSRFEWWEILANVRRALISIENGHRYMNGLNISLDLALMTHNVAALELEILSLVDKAERTKSRASEGAPKKVSKKGAEDKKGVALKTTKKLKKEDQKSA